MDIETNNLQKTKPVIKGYTLKELKDYFSSVGEKRFRGEQVFNWFYRHLIDSYNDMQNIPKTLREQLADATGEVNTLKLVSKTTSKSSGTIKYLFETSDGYKIESVIIPEPAQVSA